MSKIIHLVVKNCSECPYLYFSENLYKNSCKLSKKEIAFDNIDTEDFIHEDCPLQTY